jgi:DNA-binding NtrC family response regulator
MSIKFDPARNHRILVIDDSRAIHEDFRKILINQAKDSTDLAEDHSQLFEEPRAEGPQLPSFEVDSAYQGEDGLEMIDKSLQVNRPYSLAFVDVRMAQGWDGVETTCKIWEKYPDLQVVLCTAYSDYSWEEMIKPLGYLDRVIILKKPFDSIEVLQLAVALSEKWRLNQQQKLRVDNLEKLVQNARGELK